MNEQHSFVIIDDVAMNNLLTRLIIKSVYPDARIVEFTDSQSALTYLAGATEPETEHPDAIILLDIYMPIIDGWAFLDKFNTLPQNLKNKYKLYILSSSISKQDQEKADNNANVAGYIIKPFTKDTIRNLVENTNLPKIL